MRANEPLLSESWASKNDVPRSTWPDAGQRLEGRRDAPPLQALVGKRLRKEPPRTPRQGSPDSGDPSFDRAAESYLFA